MYEHKMKGRKAMNGRSTHAHRARVVVAASGSRRRRREGAGMGNTLADYKDKVAINSLEQRCSTGLMKKNGFMYLTHCCCCAVNLCETQI